MIKFRGRFLTIQNIVLYYFYNNSYAGFQTVSLVYISTGKYPFLSNFVDLEKRLLYNTFNEGNDCYDISNRVLLKYFTRRKGFTHKYINKRFSYLSSYRLVNVKNPRLFFPSKTFRQVTSYFSKFHHE